jgi:hypothetical protein
LRSFSRAEVSLLAHPLPYQEFFLKFALSNPKVNSPRQSLISSGAFPALIKYLVRNIDNPMANWKVIALINGDIWRWIR